VVIVGGGFHRLTAADSAADSAHTDFDFDREMIREEDEPAHHALQR
jgi:hypothetical protein